MYPYSWSWLKASQQAGKDLKDRQDMHGGKARRREKLRKQPFPNDWRRYLEDSVPLYRALPAADREELHGNVQVLFAEKRFEGAGGLDVTEPMRLAVAAQASVLLLHRETDYFPKLVSIVLYPTEYDVREEVQSDDGLIEVVDESRVGESWQTGALVLSWEDVLADLEDETQNVVLHEFAHQLDAEDGALNGAPILVDWELRQRWPAAMSAAFERLAAAVDRQQETVLDPYGIEDPAEFFAVATETFFLNPARLLAEEPNLYELLRDFYRQDPARW